jgi:DegV family protein with EDD domain
MKIAISAESTIDMPKDLLEKYDIHTVPFTILLGDVAKLDGEISTQEIFDFVEITKNLPKTSAVNEEQFKEHFASLLKDYEAVIHFSLSSEMSSAYSNAVRASENFKNVYVIDSRSLSTGIALQAIYAQKLAKLGLKPEDIVEKSKARIPYVQASFVLKKLNYLHKGGRCSSLALFGANLLGLKPQIIVKDGKMGSYHKYRGPMPKVVKDYCEDTLKEFNNPDLDVAFITYSSATEEMIQVAYDALKNTGFKTIYKTTAGGTVSSHCGENTLGILYVNHRD